MASRWILAVLVALLAVAPSAAQQPLPLDPGKDWKHKHSGIIVPATLAGTPRDRGMTYAPDELDLGLSFVGGDAAGSRAPEYRWGGRDGQGRGQGDRRQVSFQRLAGRGPPSKARTLVAA